jgi:hypothetical protein
MIMCIIVVGGYWEAVIRGFALVFAGIVILLGPLHNREEKKTEKFPGRLQLAAGRYAPPPANINQKNLAVKIHGI